MTEINITALTPETLPAPVNGRMYTYADVGRILNVSTSAANFMVIGKGGYSDECHHSAEVAARIEAAKHLSQMMGIKPRHRRESGQSPKSGEHYREGNYPTHAEEVARMRELRAEGRSNREIARMIGRTTQTIRNNIGNEPDSITEMNRALRWQQYHQRNAARRTYVIRQKIDAHNRQVEQYNAQVAAIRELEQRLEETRRNAEQALHTISDSRTQLMPIAREAGLTLHEAAKF